MTTNEVIIKIIENPAFVPLVFMVVISLSLFAFIEKLGRKVDVHFKTQREFDELASGKLNNTVIIAHEPEPIKKIRAKLIDNVDRWQVEKKELHEKNYKELENINNSKGLLFILLTLFKGK